MPIRDVATQLSNDWDRQYRLGDWDYLWTEEQEPRYALIAGWYQRFASERRAVLDVGCGEGVLLSFLDHDRLKRYVGIDWSHLAVARAIGRYQTACAAEFKVAAAEEFASVCVERFDLVIINEVLYCTSDPLGLFESYARLLEPRGAIIVSICDAEIALLQLLEQLHSRSLQASWRVKEQRSGKGWGISVFQPNCEARAES